MEWLTLLGTTVLPALLPAATDGVRALINRFSKGAQYQPGNFKDYLEQTKLDIQRFKIMNEADKHANANMPWWVDAIKALQRPFFGIVILMAYMIAVSSQAPEEVVLSLGQYVSMFGFYLFGERAYMYHQQRAR